MNRWLNIISIYGALGVLTFYSCHDTQTIIKGCCEEPPLQEKVGVGRVWVPNVFTPNGDGLHDRMVVVGDSMREIIHMKIKNKDNIVVFDNYHLPFNDYQTGWDGEFAGRVERGLYSFTVEVMALDYTIKTLKGHICNCPCDQLGDEDFKPISHCEFGLCDTFIIDGDEREYLPCFTY